jgi:hypothetical protein
LAEDTDFAIRLLRLFNLLQFTLFTDTLATLQPVALLLPCSRPCHSFGSAPQHGFQLPAGGATSDNAAAFNSSAATAHAAAAATPAAAAAAAAIAAEAEALEPHWCLGVYQRVFLTQTAATAWHGWNSMHGDPAQPFHYNHMVQHVQQQVGEA